MFQNATKLLKHIIRKFSERIDTALGKSLSRIDNLWLMYLLNITLWNCLQTVRKYAF